MLEAETSTFSTLKHIFISVYCTAIQPNPDQTTTQTHKMMLPPSHIFVQTQGSELRPKSSITDSSNQKTSPLTRLEIRALMVILKEISHISTKDFFRSPKVIVCYLVCSLTKALLPQILSLARIQAVA